MARIWRSTKRSVTPAIPTTGESALASLPRPRKGASPNEKIPPSSAASQ
jgi:hypothetical protein